MDLEGSGTSRVGSFSAKGNVGTIDIYGRTLPMLVYIRIPWNEFSYVLYQAAAFAPDRLYMIWFYVEGDAIVWTYSEGTDGSRLAGEAARGTVTDLAGEASVQFEIPGIDIPYPEIPTGFRISGDELSWVGGTDGTLTLDDAEWDFIPFEVVDCVNCGKDPWQELHAIIRRRGDDAMGLTIIYLFSNSRVPLIGHTIELNTLTDPFGARDLDARWEKMN